MLVYKKKKSAIHLHVIPVMKCGCVFWEFAKRKLATWKDKLKIIKSLQLALSVSREERCDSVGSLTSHNPLHSLKRNFSKIILILFSHLLHVFQQPILIHDTEDSHNIQEGFPIILTILFPMSHFEAKRWVTCDATELQLQVERMLRFMCPD
jgi:hypothetical protein